MGEIGWGIIGCGDVTEVKSGPAFSEAPSSRLVAVMRRDAEKAADYAARHNVPFFTGDADRIIHHPDVNAVYVATPPGSHLEYALRVCAAGKPCYVEKPMARNHAECLRMVEAFAAAELPLFVAYYRRGLDRFVAVRDLIVSGGIGVVTGINYRFASSSHQRTDASNLPWRLIASEAGGGLFLDLGCHTLDIIAFMVGELMDVEGRAANLAGPYDVEDSIVMSFRTASGALGTASWNFVSATGDDTIEIHGTEATVRLSTFGNEPVRIDRQSGQELLDLPNPRHIQGPLIQSIVAQLQGSGVCPSTGVTGAQTAAVMDSALDSFYGGRQDAFWDRPETWPGRRVR